MGLDLIIQALLLISTYGACADDVAALPEVWRPERFGYELTCHYGPIPYNGRHVRGKVDVNDRIVVLNGWDDYPITGFVLAHEVGHMWLGHTVADSVSEAEANNFAEEILTWD